MQITKVEQVVTENIVIIEKVCDCCELKYNGADVDYNSPINTINIDFGYGSRFDTETWVIDVCDDCIENWTNQFKLPLNIRNRLGFV